MAAAAILDENKHRFFNHKKDKSCFLCITESQDIDRLPISRGILGPNLKVYLMFQNGGGSHLRLGGRRGHRQ